MSYGANQTQTITKIEKKMPDNEFDWYGPETSTFSDRVRGARTGGNVAKTIGQTTWCETFDHHFVEQIYLNRALTDFLCCRAF